MTTPDITPVTAVPTEPAAVSAPETRSLRDATTEDFARSTAIACGVDPEQAVAALPPESRNPAADPSLETQTERQEQADPPAEDSEPAKWVHPEGWKYDWLDFHGDLLAIKIPSKGMINAITHAGTTSLEFQTKLVFDFESTHISEPSRERVIARLVDDNDPEYTGGEWDELQNEVLRLGAERLQKDAEELAKVKD